MSATDLHMDRSLSAGAAAIPDTPSFLEVRNLVAGYGDKIAVDGISLSIKAGEHLSLLGPSGCGKSTTLRCIAGLETPLEGEIVIDSKVVFSSAKKINVPPEKRQLSMVFQSYAIWPHMTVFENVAYGLRAHKVRGEELKQRVATALAMVGMAELVDRPATDLSGGQQQRIALARSFAVRPKAMLLDEPLSNLDARLRVRMREEIKELQHQLGLCTIYVTHDQEEAMAISDRIIVMRSGRIEQIGAPLEIYDLPRTRFVADFIGAANILSGQVLPGAPGHAPMLRVGQADIQCTACEPMPRPAEDGNYLAAVRAVYPELSRGAASGINQWPATVKRRLLLGDIVTYILDWPGGTLRVQGFPGKLFNEGEHIVLHIPQERAVLVGADRL
ncbi:ABC transporter ATP-binding protein [Paralcaligenes ureilyticus]|nr:ABC transporter ATP-binding protein [Paralcaligenes ureilyticus]